MLLSIIFWGCLILFITLALSFYCADRFSYKGPPYIYSVQPFFFDGDLVYLITRVRMTHIQIRESIGSINNLDSAISFLKSEYGATDEMIRLKGGDDVPAAV